MNDQPDAPTEQIPTPEPHAHQPVTATDSETSQMDLAQWRKIAIVTSSLFVATLALLGWQMSSDNDPALSSQRLPGGFNGQGPMQQSRGNGWAPDGQQSQGGPPQMQGGQPQDGQSQDNQSRPGPPSTRSS